jgi:uncharacterized membrane protein YozB (DUF420 family)
MNGFLPFSRGSFMMDTVFTVMIAVVPALLYGRALARARRYEAHRRVQLAVAVLLLVVVLAFEVEVRITGWKARAEPSPYYDTILFPFLYCHVSAAVAASLLWIVATWHGLRRMPKPAAPGAGSAWHKRIGKATIAATCVTAVTGWVFFYLAFVAE